jgi:hypothetical protein
LVEVTTFRFDDRAPGRTIPAKGKLEAQEGTLLVMLLLLLLLVLPLAPNPVDVVLVLVVGLLLLLLLLLPFFVFRIMERGTACFFLDMLKGNWKAWIVLQVDTANTSNSPSCVNLHMVGFVKDQVFLVPTQSPS